MHGPELHRTWTEEDIDLYESACCLYAQNNFWCYRQFINPDMILGWWQERIAYELQQFYDDFVAGMCPVLLLASPPQHGKTKQVTDFLSWVSGKNPNVKSMFTSYSDDLGVGVNTALQRIYDMRQFKRTFPLRIGSEHVVSQVGKPMLNSSLIEYTKLNIKTRKAIPAKGSFRNTTVLGQINGMGLDIGVIDDPIKGRKEAQSQTNRDSVWQWLTDDFFGRFSKNAGFIMIMTRWHVDDPAGRFLERYPNCKVVAFPAIAEHDEEFRKQGEALFPEHKPLEFLLKRKGLLTIAGWESIYQQHPIVVGGGELPIDKITILPESKMPLPRNIVKSVRYWDKAGTKDGAGAYTAGVLMHQIDDGTFVISDVRRGRWGALDREKRIKQTAESDNSNGIRVETWVEQEPGSGGKESAENTVRSLRGFIIKADRVTGAKEIRAEPYAAQVQGGNVYLIAAPWNMPFLDEHEMWPNSKFKDQVDGAAGAFMKLVSKKPYDATMGVE